MTPLSDDEKRTITKRFQRFRRALADNDPDVRAKYSAFQSTYRGDSRAFVDGFDGVSEDDKPRWIQQLETYLMDEIEPSFWSSPVDDQREAGEAWIVRRLHERASASGITVDSVTFEANPRAFGDLLILRANGAREVLDVSFTTLEDIETDEGEQTQMDAQLRDLLARTRRGR